MKSLLLMPLVLLLAGCGRYGSSKEANAACRKWVELGGEYTVDLGAPKPWDPLGYVQYSKTSVRHCELEKETSQWLGTVRPHAMGEIVPYRDQRRWDTTVKKRFPF